MSILRAVIERGSSGRYCNVVDLLDDLRGAYRPDSPQSGMEIIDAIVESELLVLDDLGKRPSTSKVQQCITDISSRVEAVRGGENPDAMTTQNYEAFTTGNMHRIRFRRTRRDVIKRFFR